LIKAFEQYDKLASLFSYPDENTAETIQKIQVYLDQNYPIAGKALTKFTKFILESSLYQIEEIFVRSFDVQSLATLDIGYVLFGDDYKRGQLLVHLNKEHHAATNELDSELADHLPNVLRLLSRMQNQEVRIELVNIILVPAIKKIISEFDKKKLNDKNAYYNKKYKTLIEFSKKYGSIYQVPLKVVDMVLRSDFKIQEEDIILQNSDFLRSVTTETNIELGNPKF